MERNYETVAKFDGIRGRYIWWFIPRPVHIWEPMTIRTKPSHKLSPLERLQQSKDAKNS